MAACLGQIWIYPIKSLDGVSVSQATVLPSGALRGDREFAMVDASDRVINGKRDRRIHRLRSTFDLVAQTVTLRVENETATATFSLEGDRTPLERWLSDYFNTPVRLIQNRAIGFPDDTASPGPTIISTATLEILEQWFPGLSLAEARRRFRTNLEIADVEPFFEDQLFGLPDTLRRFYIGDVALDGVNPCQRCVVPTRNALTGQADPNFQTIFVAKRAESLPSAVVRSRFNHFYRLAVNTRVPDSTPGRQLHLGDGIRLTETTPAPNG